MQSIPSWVDPEALLAMQFGPDRYWRSGAGLLPATSVLATTRASGINIPNTAGEYQSLGINTLPRTDIGLYGNGQFTQHAVNWDTPANESISLGTGTFTLAVWGGGSIAVAAGTAAGSGFGTATDGSPVTFTISGAGTVTLTVTGSPDYVNVTSTAFAPPAPQETGPVFASDIIHVQGVRPSNSQPEPFPGWEAEGLDSAFGINASVKIVRLNAASARTIAAVGIDANQLYHLYLDTDNRIKARLRKLGPELVTNGDFSDGKTGYVDQGGATNTVTTSAAEGIASGPAGAGPIGKTVSNGAASGWGVSVATVIGRTYRVRASCFGQAHASSALYVGTTAGGGQILNNAQPWVNSQAAWDTRAVTFTATSTTTHLTFCASQVVGRISYFALLGCREVVTHYTLQSGVISTLGNYDIAAVLNPGANSLAVSGVSGDTNASVETLPAGATTLRVGSDFGVLNPFNGWIKEMQILKVAA